MQVKLSEVIDAIDNADDRVTYFYYIPYEQVILYDGFSYHGEDLPDDFDETAEPEDMIELPDRKEVNDYNNMAAFAESYEDDEVAEWLSNSLHGAGAFRRFRAVLDRFTIQDEWQDFLEEAHKDLAMSWCEENGIAFSDDTLRFTKNPVSVKPSQQKTSSVRIVPVTDNNYMNVVFMAADFHKLMNKNRGLKKHYDEQDAQYDLEDLMDNDEIILAASDHGRFIGYAVILWKNNEYHLTELYVKNDCRRKKVATALFKEADKLASESDTELHVRVPFGNTAMLNLLNSAGYGTLAPLDITKNNTEENTNSVTVSGTSLKL